MSLLIKLRRKVANVAYRYLYIVFYKVVFGRNIPIIGKQLMKTISSWEECKGRGDIPQPKERWEQEYLEGRWDHMKKLSQLGRYAMIAGYLHFLKQQGSILDVGCGEGILLDKLCPQWYSRYVGIDISQAAIDIARQKQTDKAFFLRTDAENYIPTEKFDVIVFNESLYYFKNPFDTMELYIRNLKKSGIMIIGTYISSQRAMAILKKIKSKYILLDEAKIQHEKSTFICSVFTK
jgi:2-polyprenyl-3-methyl-5-hydroxy-6-metoxy-1,4-benzoquinol methylase